MQHFVKKPARVRFSYFVVAIPFVIVISYVIYSQTLVGGVHQQKTACLGANVPATWSVFENDSVLECSLAHTCGMRRTDVVFCALSPDRVFFGDAAFSQIELALVTDAHVNNVLHGAQESGAAIERVNRWERAAWKIVFPLDPQGVTKAASGGATWLLPLGEARWLEIAKLSAGDDAYEHTFETILSSLDLSAIAI